MTHSIDYLVAIDPGTKMSGVCLMDPNDMKPIWCKKVANELLIGEVMTAIYGYHQVGEETFLKVVIERMQGNNMPVSSDVFETCEWIGRFTEVFKNCYRTDVSYVYRREEYKALCSNIYTHNDKGVRQALVDRFAYGQPNYGKGTKKEPGWFYGFSADSWSAYAVGVTYLDKMEGAPDGLV